MIPSFRRTFLLGFALLAVAGCGGRALDDTVPPAGPEEAVDRLFLLASLEDPGQEQVDALFGPVEGGQRLAELLDAVALLPAGASRDAARVSPLEGMDKAVADVRVDLPGEGSATYNVQLAQQEPEVWRITWFQGPGVEWPPPRRRPGEALTTSQPPDAPRINGLR